MLQMPHATATPPALPSTGSRAQGPWAVQPAQGRRTLQPPLRCLQQHPSTLMGVTQQRNPRELPKREGSYKCPALHENRYIEGTKGTLKSSPNPSLVLC